MLIDHETAGNWQRQNCTAFFAQFFRCYSLFTFLRGWDKNGDFVRDMYRGRNFWIRSLSMSCGKHGNQTRGRRGVRIEGDGSIEKEEVYPKTIFDFGQRRTIYLGGIKKA